MTKLDSWLVRVVTSAAYLVQAGTGLTSYRLAQAMTVVWMGCQLIRVCDYFMPVAAFGVNHWGLGDVLLSPIWAIAAQSGWRWCQKAQAAWVAGKQAIPTKGPLVEWPWWYRIFQMMMCSLDISANLALIVHGSWPTVLEWMRHGFTLSWTLYLYLLEVYPRPLAWLRQLQPQYQNLI